MRYGALTSLFSKAATFAVQLLAMPIAARALGTENFALFALIAASMGWAAMISLGVGPVLTPKVAAARALNDHDLELRYFASAILPILMIIAVVGPVFYAVVLAAPHATFYGNRFPTGDGTVRAALAILFTFSLLYAPLSVIEALQAGHHRSFTYNTFAGFSNILSLATILFVAHALPGIIPLILAQALPLFAARSINAARFIFARPRYFRLRGHFEGALAKEILTSGLTYSTGSILATFLVHQFPLLVSGQVLPAAATVVLVVLMTALVSITGMVSMFSMPLYAAIADGAARRDRAWIDMMCRRLSITAVGYSLVVSAVFWLVGPTILACWFGPRAAISLADSRAFAAYLPAYIWEYVNYTLLIAFGRIRVAASVFALRGLTVAALAMPAMSRFGVAGILYLLTLSVLVLSAWSLPMAVRRTIRLV